MKNTDLLNKVGIVYEDNFVVVVNKPAGMLVHPDNPESAFTLVDWIRKEHPEITDDVGEPLMHPVYGPLPRPGIVHRIDAETSGILIVAKNKEAFGFIKQQFMDRKVWKVYHAFVYGKINRHEGEVDLPIGKHIKDFRRYATGKQSRGIMRDSLTYFKTMKVHNDFSYVDVYPKTGRTHQVRVHMSAIGHPIICDKLYAPKKQCILGLKRLALHASAITIKLPNGIVLHLIAPLPEDFKKALRSFDDISIGEAAVLREM